MQTLRIQIAVLALCGLLVPVTGCLPVLVGGLFYQDAKKRDARQEFMDSFRSTNLEREKAGLDPLDLCSEKYHYDRKWAMKDPNCRERINRAVRVLHAPLADLSPRCRPRLREMGRRSGSLVGVLSAPLWA